MEKIKAWVKAHPYATGVLVIGGIIVFVMFSGWFSGGSSDATYATGDSGPSDAEVAANTQLGLAQIAAQSQGQQTGAAVEIAKLQAGMQTAIATMQLQLGLTQTQAGKELGLGQQATDLNMAKVGADVQKYALGTGAMVEMNRNDNQLYQTLAIIDALKPSSSGAPAANGDFWTQYVNNPANVDILTEYREEASRDKKSQKYLQQLGIDSAPEFAQWHASQYGLRQV